MTETDQNPKSDSFNMSEVIINALEDAKGEDIQRLNVTSLTDITDYMIVATGTSDRHVMALADRVIDFMRARGWRYHGMEGEDVRDWLLIDFIDVVVHVMRDSCRKHYDLESLWDENLGDILKSG